MRGTLKPHPSQDVFPCASPPVAPLRRTNSDVNFLQFTRIICFSLHKLQLKMDQFTSPTRSGSSFPLIGMQPDSGPIMNPF